MPNTATGYNNNPLVALYFACIGEEDNDGAIYILPSIDEMYGMPIAIEYKC